jgi:hypothetical protein
MAAVIPTLLSRYLLQQLSGSPFRPQPDFSRFNLGFPVPSLFRIHLNRPRLVADVFGFVGGMTGHDRLAQGIIFAPRNGLQSRSS